MACSGCGGPWGPDLGFVLSAVELGPHEAELRGASGRRWTSRFVVDDLAAEADPIELVWLAR